jgi:hypothetical protein
MEKIQQFLKAPYYFQWLIFFFVLHGYCDFVGFIQLSSLALLIAKLSGVAWILFLACRRMYRDGHKAALFVTVLFFCYLFFGAMQDGIKIFPALASIRQFFLLNVLVCVIAFIWPFLYKRSLIPLTRLLNVLLLVYIVYDIAILFWQAASVEKAKTMTPAVMIAPVPASVQKPEVYLILLDEYMGATGLREYFDYDNTPFESSLTQKGFYVCGKPVSNYSYTVYSMASLFNMRYIDSTDFGPRRKDVYKRMTSLINNNATCAYFNQLQYAINNLSPFMLAGEKPKTSFQFVPHDIQLITDKTAYSRIIKKLPYGDFLADYKLKWLSKQLYQYIDADNESLMRSAITIAKAGKSRPAFTYVHLIMPHRPYIYDSTGRAPEFLSSGNQNRRAVKDNLYLQYLIYTNKRILQFVEDLMLATQGKAVILVMSDHGYRSEGRSKETGRARFSTLNAVYLPNRNYRLWYDSVSNVNQFPLLFNTLFGQQVPIQRDSCGF